MDKALQCHCFWCDSGQNHPERHKSRIWVSSVGNIRMVACPTCGHKEPYNPQTHLEVEDVD